MSRKHTKPEPSAREQQAIAQATTRQAKKQPRVALSLTQAGQVCQYGNNHADGKGWLNRMLEALGTSSTDFARTELNRIVNAVGASGEGGEERANAVLAVIDGIAPQNELEAMLGAQMACTHALAMEVLGRAGRVKDIEQFDSAANAAAKLLRTFAMQMEALANLRRGGTQTVQVKHVHVHSGGQAVVGNVTSRMRAGGGGRQKNAHQAQARAITHAPVASLRSQDTDGQPLPAACDTEGSLQDARRRAG